MSDLAEVETSPVHNGCFKGTVFEAPGAQVSRFQVPRGSAVPAHKHTTSWDLFFGVSGAGTVTVHVDGGSRVAELTRGSFLAVPPGATHVVTNVGEDVFEFLLTHAPFEGYDHLRITEEAN